MQTKHLNNMIQGEEINNNTKQFSGLNNVS